jgi:hypothetical protein
MKISTMAALPSLPPRSHTTAPKNTQRDGGIRLTKIAPVNAAEADLIRRYISVAMETVMNILEREQGKPPLQDNHFFFRLQRFLRQEMGLVSEVTSDDAITFKE